MKQNKILGLLVLTIFISVMASMQVMAANPVITINNPASSSSKTGNITTNFTVTYVSADATDNMTNCSLWAYSTLTKNSSYVQLAHNKTGILWISNVTETENNNFTLIWNTKQIEDANNYRIKAICSNDTAATHLQNFSSAEYTSITINNTIPSTPSSLFPATDSINSSGTVNFTCAVGDSTTTSCTITIGPTTYTAGYADSICSYQKSAIPTETYNWYCTASDQSDSVSSSVNRINIKLPSASDDILYLTKKNSPETGKPFVSADIGASDKVLGMPREAAIGVLVVVIVIVVLVWLSKR